MVLKRSRNLLNVPNDVKYPLYADISQLPGHISVIMEPALNVVSLVMKNTRVGINAN